MMAKAEAPGGLLLATAKRAAERLLWGRVALGLRRGRPDPTPVPPADVLGSRAEWESAVAECKRLGLPLHHDRPKNWDALGAVSTVIAGGAKSVLDAGSARYSSVLPWLRLYGLTDLVGVNLEFGEPVRRCGVVFQYGDITATGFPDGRFDAVTCMSVIEHGVPVEPFLKETARILKPGGVLVLSTDYDQKPPDTTGLTAYGQPVTIFGPEQIEDLVGLAAEHGLAVRGKPVLAHAERPVHWKRTGLDYTFIRLTFDRI
jgi:SAM-dependent methyltransferase